MNHERSPARSYRWRILLFLAAAIAVLLLFNTLYRGLNTLAVLDRIEAERDLWQRPFDVIQKLGLKDGDTVVDLGCGAGYFALKLASVVGREGKVLAVDLRRLSLTFLWIRALLRGERNLTVIHGDPDDPHLPSGAVRAALISNTYHEFLQPDLMLAHVFRSLRPGGRLVILDREPEAGTESHHVDVQSVSDQLLRSGFQVISRQDRFLQEQNGDVWWLLVAMKSPAH
jgi:ubiquinone/menaquinone biosynthesis C-methylase UbiE